MEHIYLPLLYTHASLGGLALLSGLTALIAKKGKEVHRISGKVFYFSMVLSVLASLVVAVLPGHENPYLFFIGIFSLYFVLSGLRALRFKRHKAAAPDYLIAVIMMLSGLTMIGYPVFVYGVFNIILGIFGTVGLMFAVNDLLIFSRPDKLRSGWLRMHLGKMTGGYISAVTAFVVVNEFIPGIYGWILPGVIGGIFIAISSRRV